MSFLGIDDHHSHGDTYLRLGQERCDVRVHVTDARRSCRSASTSVMSVFLGDKVVMEFLMEGASREIDDESHGSDAFHARVVGAAKLLAEDVWIDLGVGEGAVDLAQAR